MNWKWLVVLSVSALCLYCLVAISSAGYLFLKYSRLDIKAMEPRHYEAHIEGMRWREEDSRTAFNEYHPHFNRFGSRNVDEVSGEDNNVVVLLGDSFFFGYGLRDEETISYYLSQLDGSRKYVNLAFPGFNIHDSVARYLARRKELRPPKLILLQVLLYNDVCASIEIDERIGEMVARDYGYMLFPMKMLFDRNRLHRYAIGKAYSKIHQDLTSERFVEYVQRPLDVLLRHVDGDATKVMLVSFDVLGTFESYSERLAAYCRMRGMLYVADYELAEKELLLKERLPDGHPSARLNRVMAEQIKSKVDGLLGGH